MGVPPGDLGDFLVTDRTKTILRLPKVQQSRPSPQVSHDFDNKPVLKIGFPVRVVRICLASDFGMSPDLCVSCDPQMNFPGFAFGFPHFTCENPVTLADGHEVFLLKPSCPFA